MFYNPHKTYALGLITKEKNQRDLSYKLAVSDELSYGTYYKVCVGILSVPRRQNY